MQFFRNLTNVFLAYYSYNWKQKHKTGLDSYDKSNQLQRQYKPCLLLAQPEDYQTEQKVKISQKHIFIFASFPKTPPKRENLILLHFFPIFLCSFFPHSSFQDPKAPSKVQQNFQNHYLQHPSFHFWFFIGCCGSPNFSQKLSTRQHRFCNLLCIGI